MKDRSKLIEKIKALFRLAAEGRGASRAEAELALQRAQEMMVKYNIAKIDVRDTSEEARNARSFNIHEREYRTGRQRYETDQYIARILAMCFNVRVVWSSEYQRVPGWEWRYARDERGHIKRDKDNHLIREKVAREKLKERLIYCLIGEPEDTEFAELVARELHEMMRRLFNAYLRDFKAVVEDSLEQGETMAELRHGWLEGCRDGFILAAEKGKADAYAAESKQRVDAYAIVLVDKKSAIQKWIKENMSLSRSRTVSGSRSGTYSSHAYGKGFEAGGKLKVGQRKLN